MEAKKAEFFVEKDRTVSIAFYDAAMKAHAPTTEVVAATAEAPSGKAKLGFEKKGNLLVSKTPLPAGEHYTSGCAGETLCRRKAQKLPDSAGSHHL